MGPFDYPGSRARLGVFLRSLAWRLPLGLLAATSLVAHSDPVRGIASATGIGAILLFGMLICALSWPMLDYLVRRIANGGKAASMLLAVAFAIVGFALTYMLPVPVAPKPTLEVRVEALGKGASDAKGSEVWFTLEVDGAAVPPDSIEHGAGWSVRDGYVAATAATPVAAVWRGPWSNSARLLFVNHPWSGRARITFNGSSREIDLYSANSASPPLVVPFQLTDVGGVMRLLFPDRTRLQRLVQLIDAFLMGLVLWLLFDRLVRPASAQPVATPPVSVSRETVAYALPSLSVSIYLLLVFGPAIMSPDSIAQWLQASSGDYTDWHPAYHTAAIALARHIWDSPTWIALIQAALLAAATGWLIAVVRSATGTSVAVARLASWLCALMPIIAFTSITLWKDVPYTASVVAITAGCVSVLSLKQPRLNKPLVFLAALFIAVACMLMRHNGPPVAIAAIAVLFWLVKDQRRAIAALGVASVVVFALLKGPVSDLLEVRRDKVSFTLYAHHLAAHIAAHEPYADSAEEKLLRSISGGAEGWKYDCASVNATVFDPGFKNYVAANNTGAMLSAVVHRSVTHPYVELGHLACVSGLVWRITESPQDPLYHYTLGVYDRNGKMRWVYDNNFGLRESTMFPAQAQALGRWVTSLDFDLLWRPAAYLLLLMFAVAVAAVRMRDPRIAVVAIPILAHSGVLMLANVAQDVRYQLPVFIIALATAPAFFRARAR